MTHYSLLLLPDRPYNAEEDEARQRKKKESEIKKLEEAAKKLKAGEHSTVHACTVFIH